MYEWYFFLAFHSATLVKLEWILESISKKAVADCDRFIYQLNVGKSSVLADNHTAAPSPASKRNILLMSGQTPKQGTPKRLNFNDPNLTTSKDQSPNDNAQKSKHTTDEADDEIIDQYLHAPPPPIPTKVPAQIPVTTNAPIIEPVAGPSNADAGFKVPAQPHPKDDCERTDLDSDSNYDNTAVLSQMRFLDKMKVHIRGFDKESQESLVEDCKMAGAEVIEDNNYSGVVDLLILPVDAITMDGITVKAKCIVNHNWLVRFLSNNCLYIQIQNYPLIVTFHRLMQNNYMKLMQAQTSFQSPIPMNCHTFTSRYFSPKTWYHWPIL